MLQTTQNVQLLPKVPGALLGPWPPYMEQPRLQTPVLPSPRLPPVAQLSFPRAPFGEWLAQSPPVGASQGVPDTQPGPRQPLLGGRGTEDPVLPKDHGGWGARGWLTEH